MSNYVMVYELAPENCCKNINFSDTPLNGNSAVYLKGTGTRDLIWLKVVSLDRSWLVGLTDDL